jgi:hypothetical protein
MHIENNSLTRYLRRFHFVSKIIVHVDRKNACALLLESSLLNAILYSSISFSCQNGRISNEVDIRRENNTQQVEMNVDLSILFITNFYVCACLLISYSLERRECSINNSIFNEYD